MSTESRAVGRAIAGDDLGAVERLCNEYHAALLASGELRTLFQFAASQNRVGVLEILHRTGVAVDSPLDESTEQTSLYAAAANGATEGVRWLLAHGTPVNQTVGGESRCLPLFVAIRLGHAEIVRLLAAAGAVTQTIWNGQSPAECAVSHGHHVIAAYLGSLEAE